MHVILTTNSFESSTSSTRVCTRLEVFKKSGRNQKHGECHRTVVTPESSLGGGFSKNHGSAWKEVLPRAHLQRHRQFSLSLKGCLKMRYMSCRSPPYRCELLSTLMNFKKQMFQHRHLIDRILDIILNGVHEVRGVLEEWPQPKTWCVSPLKH